MARWEQRGRQGPVHACVLCVHICTPVCTETPPSRIPPLSVVRYVAEPT